MGGYVHLEGVIYCERIHAWSLIKETINLIAHNEAILNIIGSGRVSLNKFWLAESL